MESLAVISDLRVAAPCGEPWSGMVGDEKVRRCARCDRDVYHLSAMTLAEIEQLLSSQGSPCVRFFQRADGTVMTSDCPVGWFRRDVKRRVLAILALIGLGAGALVSLLRDPPGADVSSPKAVERGQYFQGRVVGF